MIARSLKNILFGADEKTASKSMTNTINLGGNTYQNEPNKHRLEYNVVGAVTGYALAYGSLYTFMALRPEIKSSENGALIVLLIGSAVFLGTVLSAYKTIKMVYDKEDEEHDKRINQMYSKSNIQSTIKPLDIGPSDYPFGRK